MITIYVYTQRAVLQWLYKNENNRPRLLSVQYPEKNFRDTTMSTILLLNIKGEPFMFVSSSVNLSVSWYCKRTCGLFYKNRKTQPHPPNIIKYKKSVFPFFWEFFETTRIGIKDAVVVGYHFFAYDFFQILKNFCLSRYTKHDYYNNT